MDLKEVMSLQIDRGQGYLGGFSCLGHGKFRIRRCEGAAS
jgi:hypothetical protein